MSALIAAPPGVESLSFSGKLGIISPMLLALHQDAALAHAIREVAAKHAGSAPSDWVEDKGNRRKYIMDHLSNYAEQYLGLYLKNGLATQESVDNERAKAISWIGNERAEPLLAQVEAFVCEHVKTALETRGKRSH